VEVALKCYIFKHKIAVNEKGEMKFNLKDL